MELWSVAFSLDCQIREDHYDSTAPMDGYNIVQSSYNNPERKLRVDVIADANSMAIFA